MRVEFHTNTCCRLWRNLVNCLKTEEKVFCSSKTKEKLICWLSKRVFIIPKKPLLNSTMRPFCNAAVGDWALTKWYIEREDWGGVCHGRFATIIFTSYLHYLIDPACMWGIFEPFCSFSPKLPCIHAGLHCNANWKPKWRVFKVSTVFIHTGEDDSTYLLYEVIYWPD